MHDMTQLPSSSREDISVDYISAHKGQREVLNLANSISLYMVRACDQNITSAEGYHCTYAIKIRTDVPDFDNWNVPHSIRRHASSLQSFFIDIGALKGVIGKRQLARMLDAYGQRSLPSHTSTNGAPIWWRISKISRCNRDFPEDPKPRTIFPGSTRCGVGRCTGTPRLRHPGISQLVCDHSFHWVGSCFSTEQSRRSTTHDVDYSQWGFGGHVYAGVSFPTYRFYTMRQLEKHYRHLAHPSAKKLYNLLVRSGR